MRVAICQSNYIPWKGYFDMIASVDAFVLYEDVQYTRRDWRNRNKIVTPAGVKWLTVPVRTKGKYEAPVCEIEVDGDEWRSGHMAQLQYSYRNAPYFERFAPALRELYAMQFRRISHVNRAFLFAICGWMGIHTNLHDSREFSAKGEKTERLLAILKKLNATTYVSGPAAKVYLDCPLLKAHGIEVEWKNYEYPAYPGMAEHSVSVLDMLFNVGAEEKYWRCKQ